jgi:hypothetical protein
MSSTEVINLENINYSNDTEIEKLKEKINTIIDKHYNTIRINIKASTITNKLINLISDSKINIITNIQGSIIIIEGDKGNNIDNLHNSESVLDGSVNDDKNMTNKSIYKKIILFRTGILNDNHKTLIILYPKIYFYITLSRRATMLRVYLLLKIANLLSFCNESLIGNVGLNLSLIHISEPTRQP